MSTPSPDDPIAALEALLREFTGVEAPETRPIVYHFQHVTLRQAVLENHPELVRELTNGPRQNPLLYFQIRTQMACEPPSLDNPPEDDASPALASMIELFKPVRIHSYRRDGFTAHIVTMPPPQGDGECYFVAIVHRDGELQDTQNSPRMRYLTLELSHLSSRPFFCEWLLGGGHCNYGPAEPEIGAFVDAVFDRVTR